MVYKRACFFSIFPSVIDILMAYRRTDSSLIISRAEAKAATGERRSVNIVIGLSDPQSNAKNTTTTIAA